MPHRVAVAQGADLVLEHLLVDAEVGVGVGVVVGRGGARLSTERKSVGDDLSERREGTHNGDGGDGLGAGSSIDGGHDEREAVARGQGPSAECERTTVVDDRVVEERRATPHCADERGPLPPSTLLQTLPSTRSRPPSWSKAETRRCRELISAGRRLLRSSPGDTRPPERR